MNPQIEIRICPICRREYTADTNRLKFGRQTTCSRRCSYQLRRDNRRKIVSCECSVCGMKFDRTPSQVKSKHKGIYCSTRCKGIGMSLGLTKRVVTKPYMIRTQYDRTESGKKGWRTRGENGTNRHSEATRTKLSKATSIAISSGKLPRVSKIEDIVAEELTALGIIFTRQFVIRDNLGRFSSVIDFVLPTLKIAIEVNGTFWHADPRFY